MLNRIWNSPTLMTWLSYSTKTLTLFGVLPLILKHFAPGDIVLWYLFSTIISLQTIADFGFRQTFSRVISYAYGGARDIGVFLETGSDISAEEGTPNISLLTQIVSTMRYIYLWLSVVLLFGLGIFGTWAMIKPVNGAMHINQAWYSWVIVLAVSCLSFYSKLYMNFLEGLYKIAMVRRVETLTSTGSIISSIIILLISPSLLNLVIVNQFWVLVVSLRDWYLCKKTENRIYETVSVKQPFNKELFRKIWQPAWRSGISGFMSAGLTNITGVIYAQFGSAESVAAYLLAFRIINQVRDVSMAPFYSKLPLLAMLRVKNDLTTLVKVVKRGMLLSHAVYVAGFILVGALSGVLLKAIHSEVHFVSQGLWLLLGIAYFVHRYGAMHIQVYLSTNHIISHIADGVSGTLYVISTLILMHYVGLYAVPIGMLVGYLGFYAWYAAKYSYRSMNVSFWWFEKQTSLFPVLAMVVYSVVYLNFA